MNMLAKTKGRTLVEYSHLVFLFLQSGELKGRKIGHWSKMASLI